MNCSTISTIIFIILTIIYGTAYASVAQGLKYFSPGVFQSIRMLCGFSTCLIILLFRYILNYNNYRIIISNYQKKIFLI